MRISSLVLFVLGFAFSFQAYAECIGEVTTYDVHIVANNTQKVSLSQEVGSKSTTWSFDDDTGFVSATLLANILKDDPRDVLRDMYFTGFRQSLLRLEKSLDSLNSYSKADIAKVRKSIKELLIRLDTSAVKYKKGKLTRGDMYKFLEEVYEPLKDLQTHSALTNAGSDSRITQTASVKDTVPLGFMGADFHSKDSCMSVFAVYDDSPAKKSGTLDKVKGAKKQKATN